MTSTTTDPAPDTEQAPDQAPDQAPEQTDGDGVIEGAVVEDDTRELPDDTPDHVVTLRSPTTGGILSIDPNQEKWSKAQVTALRSIGVEVDPANPDHVPFPNVWQFLHLCQVTGLDPWLRECYLITHGKRWAKSSGDVVDNRKFTLVTGIDGFRKKAEDTGAYLGQVGPQWCGEDGQWRDFWNPGWGHPVAARVGILRAGFDQPVWGVAMYDEFVALVDEYADVEKVNRSGETYTKREKTGEKSPTDMWVKMPANQLAKCAEAQGFRKAFPRQMRGLYEAAEMDRAAAEYQQQQADEAEKAARSRRSAARAAAAVTDGSERAVPAEPMRVGEAAEQVVAGLGTQQPPGEPQEAPREVPPEPEDGPVEDPRPEVPHTEAITLLRRELEWQAGHLGFSVAKLVERPERVLGKAYADFAGSEVHKVVGGLRPAVVSRLRRDGEDEVADAYAQIGPDEVVDVDALVAGPDDDPGEPGEPGGEVDPDKPHPYADQGGLCRWCGEIDENVLHS
jgi:phage recombination protein Bet